MRGAFAMSGGNTLEIKINREIRDYTEAMFFGLNMRQFAFSLLAVIVALVIYFASRSYLSISTLSCVLDEYPSEQYQFDVQGYRIIIQDNKLAEALYSLCQIFVFMTCGILQRQICMNLRATFIK
jgi:hypothetical protein